MQLCGVCIVFDVPYAIVSVFCVEVLPTSMCNWDVLETETGSLQYLKQLKSCQ